MATIGAMKGDTSSLDYDSYLDLCEEDSKLHSFIKKPKLTNPR